MSGYCPDCGQTQCICHEIENKPTNYIGCLNADYDDAYMAAHKPHIDYERIANCIRRMAIGCKNHATTSCGFGNEFAPKVEKYLRECFHENAGELHDYRHPV